MKKLFFVSLACTSLLWACKKDSSSTPSVCFTASIIDSTKIKNMDTAFVRNLLSNSLDYLADSTYLFGKMDSIDKAKVDSIINIKATGYFITLTDSTPISKQPVFFKNCASVSDFQVIYTGDPGHQYMDTSATIHGGGMYFTDSFFTYNYGAVAAGRFNVAVVATNVADFGQDIKRAVDTLIIKTK